MLVHLGPYRGEDLEDIPTHAVRKLAEDTYPGSPLVRQLIDAAKTELKKREERDGI